LSAYNRFTFHAAYALIPTPPVAGHARKIVAIRVLKPLHIGTSAQHKYVQLVLILWAPLKEARERVTAARKVLEGGTDPSAQRQREKQQAQVNFELVALEWHERQTAKWTPKYAEATMNRMKRNLFPNRLRPPLVKQAIGNRYS
jgi:hypothetical protein